MKIEEKRYWLLSPRELTTQVNEIDTLKLESDEVACETLYTAISPGTELSAYEGDEPLRPSPPPYPRWLGYMNIARVVGTGSADVTKAFPVGSIVYSHFAHRSHFVAKTNLLIAAVDDELDLIDACVAYLFRLAWVGLRRGRVEPGRRVGIVGLGAIGQCAVQLGRFFGFDVTAVSSHRVSLALAESKGAHPLSKGEARARYLDRDPDDSERMDLVLVTGNSWEDWQVALALARFNGIISLLGFPGRGLVAPEFNPLGSRHVYERQLAIMCAGLATSSVGGGKMQADLLTRDIRQVFRWTQSGEINPRDIILDVLPAPNLESAYQELRKLSRKPGTIILDWTEGLAC